MNNYPYNGDNNQQQETVGRTQPAPWRPKKKKRVGAIIGAAAAGVAAGVLVMSLAVMPSIQKNQAVTETPVAEESAAVEETAPAASEIAGGAGISVTNPNNPVPEIAEAAGKSVVSVHLYNRAYVPGQEPIDQQVGSGSGFVISADGLILTNNHVATGANHIVIVTDAGNEYEAELLGGDPKRDVALLRVEGLNLPALAIGNSDEAKTGEMVIAIGNPLQEDLAGTVTVGYLSGVNREVDLDNNGNKVSMLQTDAAINPGNSGGPLLNTNGEVIGITAAKRVYAGMTSNGGALQAEGIGYAVPITEAMDVAQQILENGGVAHEARPGIGISYAPVSAQDAQMWGVPQGAMIGSVVAGGPASIAGLREQDIIVSIDGVDLTNGADIPDLSTKNVGDVIGAVIWRNGRTYEVEMVLADLSVFD